MALSLIQDYKLFMTNHFSIAYTKIHRYSYEQKKTVTLIIMIDARANHR